MQFQLASADTGTRLMSFHWFPWVLDAESDRSVTQASCSPSTYVCILQLFWHFWSFFPQPVFPSVFLINKFHSDFALFSSSCFFEGWFWWTAGNNNSHIDFSFSCLVCKLLHVMVLTLVAQGAGAAVTRWQQLLVQHKPSCCSYCSRVSFEKSGELRSLDCSLPHRDGSCVPVKSSCYFWTGFTSYYSICK